MGYTYTCDACGTSIEDLPAFVGELREQWFKTTKLGGMLADRGYSAGETITLCGECIVGVLEDE